MVGVDIHKVKFNMHGISSRVLWYLFHKLKSCLQRGFFLVENSHQKQMFYMKFMRSKLRLSLSFIRIPALHAIRSLLSEFSPLNLLLVHFYVRVVVRLTSPRSPGRLDRVFSCATYILSCKASHSRTVHTSWRAELSGTRAHQLSISSPSRHGRRGPPQPIYTLPSPDSSASEKWAIY